MRLGIAVLGVINLEGKAVVDASDNNSVLDVDGVLRQDAR